MYRSCCVLLACCVVGSWGQGERGLPHTSPCPDVYGYGWEPAGGWHGVVTILPPAMFSEAHLVFRMTVPYYRPEAGVGRVEIKGGTNEVQAISRRAYRGERHKIQFKIIFPPFDLLPRVKEIVINGKTFCSDTRVYPDTRSTIELKYVLRTGLTLPVASGSEFSVVTNIPANNNNQHRPSKPDLVTVAILVPLDEARPMVSSPQAPTQPIGSDLQSSRPIGSGSQPSRPIGFAPQQPSRPIGAGEQSSHPIGAGGRPPSRPIESADQSRYPVGGSSQPSSHPNTPGDLLASKKPCKCNKTHSQNDIHENPGFPPYEAPKHHVFHAFSPPGSNVQINIETINDLYDIFTTTTHPDGSNGHDVNNGNSFVETSTSGFQSVVSGGTSSGSVASPTKKPPVNLSNHKETVDDKIYFVMADSDEVNSPRVVKLLEHLLVVAKKHYQVDLERLQIEKKRLALEQSPHLTLVV